MTSLRAYYHDTYPCEAVHAMLAMRGAGEAPRRAVSLQYSGNSNVYAKDVARATPDELRETLVREGAESLHMGALESDEARYGQAARKELVIDVDCTDFRRFCACQKQVCAFCWLHIEGAYLVLHYFLTAKLGLRDDQLLWVFSGGKGIHCFVNARRVLRLSDQERARIYQLLHCALQDETRDDRTACYDHAKLLALTRDYAQNHGEFLEKLEQHWARAVLQKRDALANPQLRVYLMELLTRHFPVFAQPVRMAWAQWETTRATLGRNESEARWDLLQRAELQVSNDATVRPSHYLMLRLLYPQVDQGPMRLQHRIKLPFSVHGTTQRIALPVHGDALLQLDPTRDPLSFQELTLSRVTPPQFTRGVTLLEAWVKQYDT